MRKLLSLMCLCIVHTTYTDAACTMPEELRGTAWLDNVRGNISFTTWKLSGWGFTVNNQTVDEWEIVDNVYFKEEGYLALRSVAAFEDNGTMYYSYACLKFENLTNNVYKYYVLHAQNSLAGNNNVLTADHDDLTRFEEICDRNFNIDKKLFNVLVKLGQSPSFTCPNPILTSAAFTVTLANGSVVCAADTAQRNACSNKRVLQMNNTCSHPVAYSANGRLNCISSYKVEGGDTTSVMLMNTDDVVDDVTTFRFACLIVKDDGMSMVASPRECFPDQTYSQYPTNRAGQKVGQLISITKIGSDCRKYPDNDGDDDPRLSVSEICRIVTGILVLIVIIVFIIFRVRKSIIKEEKQTI